MKNLIFILVLGISQLASQSSFAAVWETTNSWSEQWEAEYSDWVRTAWRKDVFRNPQSPYRTDMNPDCADSVYSMRIIFAFQNGLPFAILDPTSGKRLITNETRKFDSYPEGNERLNAFKIWLWDILGTVSLASDTYPIAVSREAFRPGSLILAKENKHSYMLKSLSKTGVPTLYYSTQGNEGELIARTWPSASWLFPNGLQEPSGMRYFRRPEDILKPAWQVPGYSSEQYELPLSSWTWSAQNLLANVQETPAAGLTRLMSDLCEVAKFRIEIVKKAAQTNDSLGEECMEYKTYDDLSTPGRDRQLKDAYDDLQALYNKWKKQNAVPKDLAEPLKNIFAASFKEETNKQYCMLPYKTVTAGLEDSEDDTSHSLYGDDDEIDRSPDSFFGLFKSKKKKKKDVRVTRENQNSPQTKQNAEPKVKTTSGSKMQGLTLGEVRRRQIRGLLSNNPQDPPSMRWGDRRGPSEKASSCPTY